MLFSSVLLASRESGSGSTSKMFTPEIVKSLRQRFDHKDGISQRQAANSKPLIKESNFAINADVYLRECLQKWLIPYIRENYDDNYVFWPDKASSHYAKPVIRCLCEEGVNFVEKEDNPANVPKARSIKDFWSILKGRVYAKAWKAKNTHQLTNRIKLCLKQMDLDLVQKLAENTKKRIDTIRRKGVIEDQ